MAAFKGKTGNIRLTLFSISALSMGISIVSGFNSESFDMFYADNAISLSVAGISLLIWILLAIVDPDFKLTN
ncbi:hypothetical protein [Microbulbifer sp. SSSA005]|uniref:hypothetical protein n=1 Tax=Microbulbifer sp. SSSA005 TaxID=3243378 RepID=UPI004039BC63